MNRPRRIAVVGRAGQVARSLAELGRARADLEVACLGRPDLDLTDRGSVSAALARVRPDLIVNAAAYTAVDRAESEAELAHRINADGAGWVAQAAKSLGAALIHLSTDYVFDGELRRPYREDDAVNPQGAYGQSKLAGELAVRAACPGAVVLRTAWVFSEHGANFVQTMLRLGGQRGAVRVVDDQRGSPTYATDLAGAILDLSGALLNGGAPAGGVFHLAGAGEASWADVAEAVFECAGRRGGAAAAVTRIGTAEYPTAARRPRDSRLDCGRAAAELGLALPDWRTAVDICVARTVAPQMGVA